MRSFALMLATSTTWALTLTGCGGSKLTTPTGSDLGAIVDQAPAVDQALAVDLARAAWTGKTAYLSLVGFTTFTAVGANFVDQDASCRPVVSGSCTLYPCARIASDPRVDGGTGSIADAGELDFTFGTSALTLTPSASGFYGSQTGPAPSWKTGDPILIAAKGGAVGLLSAQLTAPSRSVTFPTPQLAGLKTLVRAQDFPFSWSGNDGPEIEAIFEAQTGQTVECIYSGDAGQATVPSALLAQLPSGMGALSLRSVAHRALAVGDWDIEARAFATPDGSVATVTFQ